jgi:uncharacterized protein YaiI (UPF0178 family)
MDIIFSKLPDYLDWFGLFLKKTGPNVYYLELGPNHFSDSTKTSERVAYLKERGVLPLPLSELTDFKYFSEINYDPEMIVSRFVREMTPPGLLTAFGSLFPGITDINKKMRIIVHSQIAPQYLTITSKVNIWGRYHPDRNFLLINTSSDGFLNPPLEKNIYQIVLPMDILSSGLKMAWNGISSLLRLFSSHPKIEPGNSKPSMTTAVLLAKVAFVVHKGLDYGTLYRKDLYYSTDKSSPLHPERLIYIDYSGWSSPSEKLTWVQMGNHRQFTMLLFSSALIGICRGLFHVRRLRHILGLIALTRSYCIYRSFLQQIQRIPDLKVALIDYDFLCPKEFILACESLGITTIASQERFISTFGNLFSSLIVRQYLCNSRYAADMMQCSEIKCVDEYIPVGQYRSDELVKERSGTPPVILARPIAEKKKIITALGFHTHLEWHHSQTAPLLNWNAHIHFIEDLIRLSRDIPGVFIILRYKNLDWISLPVFSEVIQKIRMLDNIVISEDYDKDYVSYELCAHSDLVIAKHTSLADECLSVGIPVLFHEYNQNSERFIADAFDYSPTNIMCFNYDELKERAQIILSGTPNEMTKDYNYLKREVYAELGDGKVKERIYIYIEKMLSEIKIDDYTKEL